MLRGRSGFGRRAAPERSEGGWSEEVKNREGVASGAQHFFLIISPPLSFFALQDRLLPATSRHCQCHRCR